tara:strand:- start:151 stop:753 length:603 start_codon:yes stop_codon:yes gene_type:complete
MIDGDIPSFKIYDNSQNFYINAVPNGTIQNLNTGQIIDNLEWSNNTTLIIDLLSGCSYDCAGICNGDSIIDECGVCGGSGPIDCIDEYGISQGSFCTQEECEEYLLDATNAIPTQLVLGQNYPNPFNPTTIIEYGVPNLSKTNISLYDLQGRKLKTLINSIHNPGYYHLTLTLDDLYSGIYIVKIVSDNTAKTRKIALVK